MEVCSLKHKKHKNARRGSHLPPEQILEAPVMPLITVDTDDVGQKESSIYPQSPANWCVPGRYTSTPSLVRGLQVQEEQNDQQRRPYNMSRQDTSRESGAVSNFTTIKRAAVRVRAIAKLKMSLHHSTSTTLASLESKMKRVEEMLEGIRSENQHIAVDSAKGLGYMNCREEAVVEGLKEAIQKDPTSLLAYECF